MHPSSANPKVLIVTGGYLSAKEESLAVAAWKQLVQSRYARHSWLEAKVKATLAPDEVRLDIKRDVGDPLVEQLDAMGQIGGNERGQCGQRQRLVAQRLLPIFPEFSVRG